MPEELNQNPTEQAGENTETTTEAPKTAEEIKAELEAEYQKKLQSEVDRRITQAMKKKEEEVAEKERLAKLTEEERFTELQKQKEEEITKREQAIRERELAILLRDTLTDLQLPSEFKDIISVSAFVGKEDGELVQAVKTVGTVFEDAVNKRVEKAKGQYLKGKTPKSEEATTKTDGISKEQFQQMTYKERVVLMNQNPQLYKQLTAQ